MFVTKKILTKKNHKFYSNLFEGKVPAETLSSIVFPKLGAPNSPNVLIGSSLGVDGAILSPQAFQGLPVVVTSDPITGSVADLGKCFDKYNRIDNYIIICSVNNNRLLQVLFINNLGRLSVIVNANDISVMGGAPRFMTLTLLLPPGEYEESLKLIMDQGIYLLLSLSLSLLSLSLSLSHLYLYILLPFFASFNHIKFILLVFN